MDSTAPRYLGGEKPTVFGFEGRYGRKVKYQEAEKKKKSGEEALGIGLRDEKEGGRTEKKRSTK